MSTKTIKNQKPGFLAEFRTFAVKGDAFNLAIAVVVGNAFSAVVNGLVANIITPLLGLVTGSGDTDIKNLSITLRPLHLGEQAANAQPLLLQYGAFLQTIINFLIITLSIFVVFKLLSHARTRLFRQGADAVPEAQKSAQERLLEEIRDLLKAGK